MIPWSLLLFCCAIIFFQTRIRYNDRERSKNKNDLDEYLREEMSANYSRTKPIDDIVVHPDRESLPFGITDSPDVIEIEETILTLMAETLIKCNLTSAREIKRQYGGKNFNKIIKGEENYLEFIKNLNNWARLCIDNRESAEAILNEAVRLGSEMSETYTLLQTIKRDTK